MLRILFVFSLFLSNLLLASAEFVPLQERAEGHSLTGASLQNDSLYSNPAGGAFQKVYSLDGQYALKNGFAVSVLDTRTSDLGGGLGYFRMPVEGAPEGTDNTQGARAALFSKTSETVAFGATGKMIWSPSIATPKEGEVRTSEKLIDVDLGMLTNFGTIQFGTNMRNIMGGNEALGIKREMALGGRINWNQLLFFSLTMVSDISYFKLSSLKPYEYGVGAEFMTPYYFAIKGGYHYRTEAGNSTWSMGASFISPKFNLHYALELPQYENGNPEHTFGMTVFL